MAETKKYEVTILLPAFNEEGVIGTTVQRIRELYPDYEILVVDDDLLSQKMISTMPAKLGYQSDVAGNGLEALHLLSGRQYDLVLMN